MSKNEGEHKTKYEYVREVMFLWNYLLKNSSKDHKLSRGELISALDAYRTKSDKRVVYQRAFYSKDVYNKVDTFLEVFSDEPEHGSPYDFLHLHIIDKNEFPEGTGITAKSIYAEGPLTDETICLLRDAIAVYPYAETKKTKEIIEQLNALATKFSNNLFYMPEVEAEKYPGTYYQNLTEIYKALSKSAPEPEYNTLKPEDIGESFNRYEKKQLNSKKKTKLRLEYCMYQYDAKTKKIVLTPRIMKNGQTFREVNPLMLLWSNGFYYLVVYYFDRSKQKYIYQNLRVDRMRNVTCTDKEVDAYTDKQYNERPGFDGKFSPRQYVSRNPVMHFESEQLKEVRIRCKNSCINNAIDTFGFELDIENYTADETTFIIRKVSASGVLMWALEYSDRCEILYPQSLREQMKEYGQKRVKYLLRR